MRRIIMSTTLVMLAFAAFALPASAGRVWCARDPLIRIDGTDIQIWVAIPQEFVPYVTDAVKVRVATPRDLSREVLYTDAGFNGYGERVEWVDARPARGSDRTPLNIDIQVVVDQRKIDQDFGKGTKVPVQAIVNIGATTQTFEYVSTKNNTFTLTLEDGATGEDNQTGD